jgi:hypothetical protein
MFCEVKIVQDPANYRLIEEVLKNGFTPTSSSFDGQQPHRRSSENHHHHHHDREDEGYGEVTLIQQQSNNVDFDGSRPLVRSSSKASMKALPKKVRSSLEQARRRSIESHRKKSGSSDRYNKNRGVGGVDDNESDRMSLSLVDVYGMSEDRRSLVFSPGGSERPRRNSEMGHLASTNRAVKLAGGMTTSTTTTSSVQITNRAQAKGGRWSGNYSPTANVESPHIGFNYHCNLIDGFEPDCGPDKRILILS